MNCQKTREAIDAGIGKSVLAGHLANCSDCESYSNELSSLLSLLREQPRVEVPTDFEFRLKARIARAQAGEVESAVMPGWVSKLWTGSFSWVQATAATAAVALVVSVSTYQIYQNNHEVPTGSPVAMSNVSGRAESPVISDEAPRQTAPTSERLASARQLRQIEPQVAAVEETSAPSIDPAATANSMNIFNGEQGRMITTSSQMMLIGAEGSNGTGVSGSRNIGYVPSI